MNNEYFMEKAIEQARLAGELLDVPVGCVITEETPEGEEIIAYGFNKRNHEKNPLCHAELIAIDMACKKTGDWRLSQCNLYVTIEPCAMCAGAILQSRIKKLIFGAKNPKAGCCGSILNIVDDERFNHRVEIVSGVLETQCSSLISGFFGRLRVGTGSPTTHSE